MNRRNMLSHSCLTTDPPPTPRSPVTSAFSSTVQSLKRKKWECTDLSFFQVTIDNPLGRCFLMVKMCCGTSAKAQKLLSSFGQSTDDLWILNCPPLFHLQHT